MTDLLTFTRKEVAQAADSPVIQSKSAIAAYKTGDPSLLKRWVARALHRQMTVNLGLWHWLKWKWSGLSRHEYAVNRVYAWLQTNPVRLLLE